MRQCWINPTLYRDLILAESSLIAYWPATDMVPGIADIKGGFNAVLTGGFQQGVHGPLTDDDSPSIFFNGVNAKGLVPYNAALNPAVFSVEGWFIGGANGNNPMLECRPASSGPTAAGFDLFIGASGLNPAAGFSICSANVAQTIISFAMSLNLWHHILASYDGSQSRLYVDGVLRVTSAVIPFTPNPSRNLGIGSLNLGGNFLKGSQGQLALYGAALGADRALAHFQAGAMPVIYVDSFYQPPQSPAPAGNAIVPAGYIHQIGSDGLADTRSILVNGKVVSNIDQYEVPYFSGGWPPDPLTGQPGHTPQRPTGEG